MKGFGVYSDRELVEKGRDPAPVGSLSASGRFKKVAEGHWEPVKKVHGQMRSGALKLNKRELGHKVEEAFGKLDADDSNLFNPSHTKSSGFTLKARNPAGERIEVTVRFQKGQKEHGGKIKPMPAMATGKQRFAVTMNIPVKKVKKPKWIKEFKAELEHEISHAQDTELDASSSSGLAHQRFVTKEKDFEEARKKRKKHINSKDQMKANMGQVFNELNTREMADGLKTDIEETRKNPEIKWSPDAEYFLGQSEHWLKVEPFLEKDNRKKFVKMANDLIRDIRNGKNKPLVKGFKIFTK